MDEHSTIRDLRIRIAGDVGAEISLALMMASSANDILAQVDPAIDHILQKFARTPKERQDRSEDGLSMDLITSLQTLGFQASHDTTTGGHCDIVIDGRYDFLWLGEAKKHRDYDWLLKGFNQLDARYATATKNQDRGGVVIYHYGPRVDEIMNSWEEHLKTHRTDVEISPRNKGDLEMNTSHVHKRTGRKYHVRHVIVSLYWDPKRVAPS
jgi:hypothetical protein